MQDVANARDATRINLANFAGELSRQFDFKLDGGWFVIFPRDPDSNTVTRLDRRTFSEFLSALRAAGATSLREFARLTAAHQVSPQQSALYKLTLNAYRAKGYGIADYSLGFPLTSALGLLSQAQWDALGKDGLLRLGAVPQAARSWILQWTTTGPKALDWTASVPAGASDLSLNESDAFPFGLPTDAILQAEADDLDVLFDASGHPPTKPRVVSLVAGDVSKALAEGSVQSAAQLLGGQYALGTMRLYRFRLLLPSGQFIQGKTSDPAVLTGGKTYNYSDLPERLRHEIESGARGNYHDSSVLTFAHSTKGPFPYCR